MRTRTLGTVDGGWEVSATGSGCTGTSQSYGTDPGDRAETTGVLRAAVERGDLLRHRRGDQVVIATEFGCSSDAHGEQTGLGSRPEQVRAAVEGSLGRRGTDVIDHHHQHRVNPDVPIEEDVGASELDLSPEELAGIEQAAADIRGARYPEHLGRTAGS